MPKKETFTSRFEETRGGRVPQKSKIWGDVVYGWSLSTKYFEPVKTKEMQIFVKNYSKCIALKVCEMLHIVALSTKHD